MIRLSHRVRSLSESGTVAIAGHAARLAAAGRDIVNLSVGAPDFETPAHVSAAAIEAIRRGETRYSTSFGRKSGARRVPLRRGI